MVHTRILSLFLLAGIAAVGCSKQVNPVSSNVSYGPDDKFATRVLDQAERDEVLEVMRDSFDRTAVDPARPAEYGVRWRDVGLAAQKASGHLELAVVSITEEEDGAVKRIQLVSVGEVPVEMVVRMVPPPEIYEATATAGLFKDRAELAKRLVQEFDVAMRAYGAKPGWPPLKNE